MKKGKTNKKKEKKYLSVIVIPHSSEKVKVFKFTAIYPKIAAVAAFVLACLFCLGCFSFYIWKQNQFLKSSVSTLSNLTAEQQSLLEDKNTQIDELKVKEAQMDNAASEYIRKFSELTDKYFTNKTNRSGNSNDRMFISDVEELKKLLDAVSNENISSGSNDASLTEMENKLKTYMETIPTLWPTRGRITSSFGERNDPFYFTRRYHEGIDIAAPHGQTIKAAAKGTVTFSGRNGGYGNVVFIDHGYGISTVYGHASRLLVKKGQVVKKGQGIAEVGSTGKSTGDHLHFEIRINDEPVDPLKYLSNNE